MTSSLSDWENVNVKSELQPFPTDKMEIDEYTYDIIFKNVQPSNHRKLDVTIYFLYFILKNLF